MLRVSPARQLRQRRFGMLVEGGSAQLSTIAF